MTSSAPVFVQPGAVADGWAYLTNKVMPEQILQQHAAGRELAGVVVVALFATPNTTVAGEWLVAPVKASGLSLSMADFCARASETLRHRAEQIHDT